LEFHELSPFSWGEWFIGGPSSYCGLIRDALPPPSFSFQLRAWPPAISFEVPAKLLKAGGSCHSGQAKRDPEARIFKEFWIPAPALDSIRGSPE